MSFFQAGEVLPSIGAVMSNKTPFQASRVFYNVFRGVKAKSGQNRWHKEAS